MPDSKYIEELKIELKSLKLRQDAHFSDYRAERVKHLRERLNIVSVLLEVEEIAVGDYSPEYGTVEHVLESDDHEDFTFTFVNGTVINQSRGNQLEIDQGGRFNHG